MIKLRPYHVDDLDPLVRNANNPKVARFLRDAFPSPFTVDNGRWWIEEGCHASNGLHYAIEYYGTYVGGIGAVFFEDERKHSAEVGYWVGEAHWGKGIATKALTELSTELLALDNIHRLFSPVADPNIGSMRVLEKCGFELEGVLRQAMTIRSRTFDAHIFGRLKN